MNIIVMFCAGLICFGSCWISFDASAQQVVFDPQYMAAVIENSVARNAAETTHQQYLSQINTNINDINTSMGTVVLAQSVIFNSLANVNSALKNGLTVKNAILIINDMKSHLSQCLVLAKQQPYLLLFASNIQQQLQQRAISLMTDVSQFITKEGDNILADFNSRDHVLHKVVQQLQIMDSLAYGAWRAMFWANERSLIASINPYASWISQDKAFVTRIIQNAKYLHQ